MNWAANRRPRFVHLKKVTKEKTQPLDTFGKYGRKAKYSVGGQVGINFRGASYKARNSHNVLNEPLVAEIRKVSNDRSSGQDNEELDHATQATPIMGQGSGFNRANIAEHRDSVPGSALYAPSSLMMTPLNHESSDRWPSALNHSGLTKYPTHNRGMAALNAQRDYIN